MTWIRHVLPFITSVHRWLYLRSGGWVGGSAIGFKFVLLEHVGRKTGTTRLTPILYVPDGDRFVLAASNAGQDRHPAWWLNLEANPEVKIRVGRRAIAVKARRAGDAESERLWPLLTDSYRWFDEYREVTDREIPIVLLEPEADAEELVGAELERVEVEHRFDAAPEAVWRVFTDHARWSEWAGTPGSRLVQPGRPDPDGPGAVRGFVGGMREEVLEFEPPRRMTYRVVGGLFPVKDHLGEAELFAEGGGTRLVWRCRFRPRLPGTGRLLRRLVTATFTRALVGLERRGFGPSPPS